MNGRKRKTIILAEAAVAQLVAFVGLMRVARCYLCQKKPACSLPAASANR